LKLRQVVQGAIPKLEGELQLAHEQVQEVQEVVGRTSPYLRSLDCFQNPFPDLPVTVMVSHPSYPH
jgi:hypothetical protein